MAYVFPDRKPYDWHVDYPAPSEWADVVAILREARDLIERGCEQFICIACLRAAREQKIAEPRLVLELTEVIEDRLRPCNNYDTWLCAVQRASEPLDRQAVLQARLAWIDDLIREFSQ